MLNVIDMGGGANRILMYIEMGSLTNENMQGFTLAATLYCLKNFPSYQFKIVETNLTQSYGFFCSTETVMNHLNAMQYSGFETFGDDKLPAGYNGPGNGINISSTNYGWISQ